MITSSKKVITIVVVVAIIGFIAAVALFGFRKNQIGTTFIGRLFPISPAGSPPSSTSDVGNQKTSDVFPGGENKTQTQQTAVLGTSAAANLPIGSLMALSGDPVASLAVSATTTYYHKNTPENLGHLFSRKADGTDSEKRISNFTIPQIIKVMWSPDAKKAVIFYQTSNETRKILVDYRSTSTPKTNFLPDSVSSIAFSPDSKSIAFINSAAESQNVFLASDTFANQRKIFDNRIPYFEISWPHSNLISLITRSSSDTTGFLYSLNIETKEFTKIIEGAGLSAVWKKDGTGVLYSTAPDLSLKFLDIKSKKVTDLGTRTPAEKCVFANSQKNTVYCAIPQNIPTGEYPDDWWKGKISFLDTISAINLETLNRQNTIATSFDVIKPTVLQNDSYFLFQDKNTGMLWSLKLK